MFNREPIIVIGALSSNAAARSGKRQKSNLLAITIALYASLTACGGGGGGGASSDSKGGGVGAVGGGGSGSAVRAPIVQSASLSLNAIGVAASSGSGTITASDPDGRPLTYAVTTSPRFGTATVAVSTGAVTYTIAGHPRSTTDSFVVTVSNGQAQSTAQVAVQIAADPLLQNQWHIQNVGQDALHS